MILERSWYRCVVGLLATFVVAGSCLVAAQSAVDETLEHAGYQRGYRLHVPAGIEEGGASAVPLVVLLHGRGGSGSGMAQLSGFDDLADEHGFIVVYPDGIDNQWNYVDGIEGYQNEVPDSDFLRALVAYLADSYPVDSRRVYVAGFSNGGFMAQRLACDGNDLFAAFASVGAAGYGGQPASCGEPEPVSILFMHGTKDTVVPFAGLRQQGPNGPVTVLASVEQTFGYWTDRIGCSTTIDARQLAAMRSADMEVHVLDATNCPADHQLELVVIVGGGHNWPGRPGLIPSDIGGEVNLDIDASSFIWSFFERHALLGR